MADDAPRPRTNPRTNTPDRDPSLEPPRNPGQSLFEELGAIADDVRQINVDLGGRPYRCFSVVVRWSGGQIGKGTAAVVSETELTPTPFVDLRPMRSEMTAAGKKEAGFVKMKELSPRFTEDDIRTLFHVQPLPAGHQGFIEVRHDQRDGETARRRYTVRGVPWRDIDNFQWIARMSDEEQNRNRDGTLSERQYHPGRDDI